MYDDDPAPSIEDAKTRVKMAQEQLEAAQKRFNAAEGDILKAHARVALAAHPEIKRIGFEGTWGYDDEGSYFWSVSVRTDPKKGVIREEPYESKNWRTGETKIIFHTIDTAEELAEELLDDNYDISVDAWMAASDAEDIESGGWLKLDDAS